MRIKEINQEKKDEVLKVRKFLKENFGLGHDEDTEYTLVIEEDEAIVATASFSGNVIKQVAIQEIYRGEGYATILLEKLINKMISLRIVHLFVYTKPLNLDIFLSMGFKKIASVYPHVVLLEWGNYSFEKYRNDLVEHKRFKNGKIGALVMNCNPFTRGHRYLVEKASQECKGVYLFIVEEENSVIPFKVRFNLVREGTKDLKNVEVLHGGKYVITSATFPSYFTHQDDLIKIQTELDSEIFGSLIAKVLNINTRYVGNEPYCPVTRQYNDSLKKILPRHGVEVVEVSRKESDNEIISAKKVREAIQSDDWHLVEKMVPKTTFEYLKSEDCANIVESIKKMDSRH
jgi:[citrate (pro-3S)-lyase] ligase